MELTFETLPNKKYQIIYADPPWRYARLQSCGTRAWTNGAVSHYPTVAHGELCKLPVESIAANDCLLFMWACSPLLDEAIQLGKAWAFQYKTVGFVWFKQATVAGNYTMSQCELCLIFKRGRIPQPRGARNVPQFLSEPRAGHSSKPHEIRRRIDEMFPKQEKIELFARQRLAGWDTWGIEAEGGEQGWATQTNLL